MRDKSAFIITASFLVWVLIVSASIGIVLAATSPSSVLEQAKATSLQGAHTDTPAHSEDKSNNHLLLGFTRFEPLLLLLLGSIMFSLGTVINLMLSKRKKDKSIQAVTSNK